MPFIPTYSARMGLCKAGVVTSISVSCVVILDLVIGAVVVGVLVQTVTMVAPEVGSMVFAVVVSAFLVEKMRAKDSASSLGSSTRHLLK